MRSLSGLTFTLFLLLASAKAFGNDMKKPVTPLSDSSLSQADDQAYETALCGPQTSQGTLQQQTQNLRSFDSQMPPIKDQGDSGWCWAFSTSDLLDEYIHSQSAPGIPYDEDHQVSVIDLTGKLNAGAHQPNLDFSEGADQFATLVALQNGGNTLKIRSDFDLSSASTEAKQLVDELFYEYKDTNEQKSAVDHVCRTSSETNADFIASLSDFLTIKGQLDKVLNQSSASDNGVITSYDSFAKGLDVQTGGKTVTIPSFVANQFETDNFNKYFSKLGKVLKSGDPVSVGLCAGDIDPQNTQPYLTKDDPCGGHAATVVKAGWVGGKCMVRLRNSWGVKWGTDHPPDGYFDLTVSQLEKSVRDTDKIGGSPNGNGAPHAVTWISKDGSKNEAVQEQDWSTKGPDGSALAMKQIFSGKMLLNSDGDVQPTTGVLSDASGTLEYKDGTAVAAKKRQMFDDKSTFTGTLGADEDTPAIGVRTFPDGSTWNYSANGILKQ